MSTPKQKLERIKVGDNLKKSWPKTNQLMELFEQLIDQVASAQQEIKALQKRTVIRDFFPFCIYVYPTSLRASPGANDWRTVRVRGGTIFVNGTEVVVTGTDEAEFPYSGAFGTPASADIICPAATPEFWCWIVITDPSGTPAAAIDSGDTPPVWDSTHIPIGFVDSDTYGAEKRIIIRQFMVTDLFTIVC